MTATANMYGQELYYDLNGKWRFDDEETNLVYTDMKELTMEFSSVIKFLSTTSSLIFSRKEYDKESLDGTTCFDMCITVDRIGNLQWLDTDGNYDEEFSLDMDDATAKDWYIVNNHPRDAKQLKEEPEVQFNEHMIEIKEIIECLDEMNGLNSIQKIFVEMLKNSVTRYAVIDEFAGIDGCFIPSDYFTKGGY